MLYKSYSRGISSEPPLGVFCGMECDKDVDCDFVILRPAKCFLGSFSKSPDANAIQEFLREDFGSSTNVEIIIRSSKLLKLKTETVVTSCFAAFHLHSSFNS